MVIRHFLGNVNNFFKVRAQFCSKAQVPDIITSDAYNNQIITLVSNLVDNRNKISSAITILS